MMMIVYKINQDDQVTIDHIVFWDCQCRNWNIDTNIYSNQIYMLALVKQSYNSILICPWAHKLDAEISFEFSLCISLR